MGGHPDTRAGSVFSGGNDLVPAWVYGREAKVRERGGPIRRHGLAADLNIVRSNQEGAPSELGLLGWGFSHERQGAHRTALQYSHRDAALKARPSRLPLTPCSPRRAARSRSNA